MHPPIPDEEAKFARPQSAPENVFRVLLIFLHHVHNCALASGARLPLALSATFAGGLATLKGTNKGLYVGYGATGKSAFTYFIIALLWCYIDNAFSWMALCTPPILGALIAPCLSPWIRLFPITGDPCFSGWRRMTDMAINAFIHTTATSCFIFIIKLTITVFSIPFFLSFNWPSFFKGSIGLVLANYIRRYLTEYLGTHFAVYRHPLELELLSNQQNKQSSQEEKLLAAWNELRELPGPGICGLLWRGWGAKPGGYRSLIDQSKLLDPALGGLIDHVLRSNGSY